MGKAELVGPKAAVSIRAGGGLGHDEVRVWFETNLGLLAAVDAAETALLLMLVKAWAAAEGTLVAEIGVDDVVADPRSIRRVLLVCRLPLGALPWVSPAPSPAAVAPDMPRGPEVRFMPDGAPAREVNPELPAGDEASWRVSLS